MGRIAFSVAMVVVVSVGMTPSAMAGDSPLKKMSKGFWEWVEGSTVEGNRASQELVRQNVVTFLEAQQGSVAEALLADAKEATPLADGELRKMARRSVTEVRQLPPARAVLWGLAYGVSHVFVKKAAKTRLGAAFLSRMIRNDGNIKDIVEQSVYAKEPKIRTKEYRRAARTRTY